MPIHLTKLSTYALPLLETVPAWRVHSIYRKTINLQNQDHLLAIQAAGSPFSPISLLTDAEEKQLSSLRLKVGDILVRDDHGLTLSGNLVFSCPSGVMQNPLDTRLPAAEPSALDSIRNSLEFLTRQDTRSFFSFLLHGRTLPADFQPLMTDYADSVLQKTSACYREEKEDAARVAPVSSAFSSSADSFFRTSRQLCRLIGLGIGLTPSGDDFLTGVLAGLRLRGLEESPLFAALAEQIRHALSRTNDISRAFLVCALEGHFSQAVLSLKNEADPALLRQRFAAIGHSSGMDTAAGILYCLRYPDQ